MKRFTAIVVAVSIVFQSAVGFAQPVMPQSALMPLSGAFVPVLIKGMVIHPDDPLRIDFIVDNGQTAKTGRILTEETTHLVKYFLAALAVPQRDLWVNFSPVEKDRIIEDDLARTAMGRDMLAQDLVLKQLTASLLYPGASLGESFWEKVYALAQKELGTTDIPVESFNKVWITPANATVYRNGNRVFIADARLKVMLDSDRLAQNKIAASNTADDHGQGAGQASQEFFKRAMRDIILPVLEEEVNRGKSFARTRQIFHALVLANWYRAALKESLIGKIYADAGKTGGLEIAAPLQQKQALYEKYIETFRKGAFNIIQEEVDQVSGELIPRKYVSGGVKGDFPTLTTDDPLTVPGSDGELSMIPYALRESGAGGPPERFLKSTVLKFLENYNPGPLYRAAKILVDNGVPREQFLALRESGQGEDIVGSAGRVFREWLNDQGLSDTERSNVIRLMNAGSRRAYNARGSLNNGRTANYFEIAPVFISLAGTGDIKLAEIPLLKRQAAGKSDYITEAGDTLLSVASRTGLPVSDVRSLSGLGPEDGDERDGIMNDTPLVAGQVLLTGPKRAFLTEESFRDRVPVRESFAHAAARVGLMPAELARQNGLRLHDNGLEPIEAYSGGTLTVKPPVDAAEAVLQDKIMSVLETLIERAGVGDDVTVSKIGRLLDVRYEGRSEIRIFPARDSKQRRVMLLQCPSLDEQHKFNMTWLGTGIGWTLFAGSLKKSLFRSVIQRAQEKKAIVRAQALSKHKWGVGGLYDKTIAAIGAAIARSGLEKRISIDPGGNSIKVRYDERTAILISPSVDKKNDPVIICRLGVALDDRFSFDMTVLSSDKGWKKFTRFLEDMALSPTISRAYARKEKVKREIGRARARRTARKEWLTGGLMNRTVSALGQLLLTAGVSQKVRLTAPVGEQVIVALEDPDLKVEFYPQSAGGVPVVAVNISGNYERLAVFTIEDLKTEKGWKKFIRTLRKDLLARVLDVTDGKATGGIDFGDGQFLRVIDHGKDTELVFDPAQLQMIRQNLNGLVPFPVGAPQPTGLDRSPFLSGS